MAVTLEQVVEEVQKLRADVVALQATDAAQAQQHDIMTRRVEEVATQLNLAATSIVSLQAQGQHPSKLRLDYQAAKDLLPSGSWGGLEDKKLSWREFHEEIVNYADALYLDGPEVLEEVEKIPDGEAVNPGTLRAGEVDMVPLLDTALYRVL